MKKASLCKEKRKKVKYIEREFFKYCVRVYSYSNYFKMKGFCMI